MGKGKAGKGKDKQKVRRKELRKLRRKVDELRARLAAPSGPRVSPLAVPLPDLPAIDGVRLATARAGVKAADRTDVMLAELAQGTAIAGAFTRSATRSAAVLDCEAKLAARDGSGGWAILVNSGNANAFTGAVGRESVEAVCTSVSHALGLPPARVLTSSTGVIGERLPHERITATVDAMADALSPGAMADAAHAIMTTDTFPKGASRTLEIDGATVTIAGIAKGSGMIAPDMATMLAYVFTDATVSDHALQAMASDLTRRTFNAVTVDGDTSTSDTLIVAATNRAAHAAITSARTVAGRTFKAALHEVLHDLALQLVRDGEGATKLLEVRVTGAANPADARRAAAAIANSPLVKTAVAGEDPNWGRVVMAIGKSGARADRDRIAISLGDVVVARDGRVAEEYQEAVGAAYMTREEIVLGVDLGVGAAEDVMWTCDLTKRYVEINADYRS